MCVAPIIADESGARRAGQGRAAAKRTLDAPKRSRKIDIGATAGTVAGIVSRMRFLIGASPCAMAAHFRPEIWCNIFRKSSSETTAGWLRTGRRELLASRA